MTDPGADRHSHGVFSLTRMIYTICSAVILYITLLYIVWYLAAARLLPDALSRIDLWDLYPSDVLFVLAMLVVVFSYRPKVELFRWPSSTQPSVGALLSLLLGLGYGLAAFALASSLFWIGDRRIGSVRVLIAHASSPLRVLALVGVLIVPAAISEIVSRGVLLRTIAGYTTTPAAILASASLSGAIYPALGFPAAVVLGLACSVLYSRTRNLLAPIIANIVFVLSGAILSLYHNWMHLGPVDTYLK